MVIGIATAVRRGKLCYILAMLRIKNFELNSKVIQSPMAGCTNLPFRLIARENGMAFAFPEMISCEALVRETDRTLHMLERQEQDRPLGVQLMGCDPEKMGRGAAILEDMGFDVIDINFGCPAPKVAGKGSGSALLGEPETARQIFQSMVKSVKKAPVTVKMRLGVKDPSGKEALHIAKIAEDCGLSAISVHGRTREQGYSGKADWEAIGRIKQSVKIPVIGNGDIKSGEDAREIMRVSGCDAVMIGRGALGNPWIYKEIEAALENRAAPARPSQAEIKKTLLKHLALETEFEGPRVAFFKSKKISSWYFNDFAGCSDMRRSVYNSKSLTELLDLIHAYPV